MSGIGAFCFCENLEEWKQLYPAIIFIDALLDKDFNIYEEQDLQNLISTITKYQDSEWNEVDFHNFKNEINKSVLEYEVNFLGLTIDLFEQNSNEVFIENLHKGFKYDLLNNESQFIEYLYGFGH